jgi:hypothetical protein
VALLKEPDLAFRTLKMKLRVADEKVFFDEFSIEAKSLGDWNVGGSVGFDAGLGLTLANRLPKNLSNMILGAQSQLKGLAKDALAKTKLAGASGLVDGVGIQPDKEGRVSVLMDLGGNVVKPKPGNLRFGQGDGAPSKQPSVKEQAVKQVKAVLDQKKKELEAAARQKLDEQKQKAAAELEKQKAAAEAAAAEQKKKLEAEAQKKTSDVKKKATEKLKGLF